MKAKHIIHYSRKNSTCSLTGNVGDHDEDEEGVVVEREVILVREGDRVQARLLHIRQSCIDGQQFSAHSHWIQHDEKGVPAARYSRKKKAQGNK